MRLSDFILLTKEEKKLIVLHEGVLVAKRADYHHLVFLFQFDHYYVEAFCNVENKAIEEYRVFDHYSPLSPYLDNIPIDHLMN